MNCDRKAGVEREGKTGKSCRSDSNRGLPLSATGIGSPAHPSDLNRCPLSHILSQISSYSEGTVLPQDCYAMILLLLPLSILRLGREVVVFTVFVRYPVCLIKLFLCAVTSAK